MISAKSRLQSRRRLDNVNKNSRLRPIAPIDLIDHGISSRPPDSILCRGRRCAFRGLVFRIEHRFCRMRRLRDGWGQTRRGRGLPTVPWAALRQSDTCYSRIAETMRRPWLLATPAHGDDPARPGAHHQSDRLGLFAHPHAGPCRLPCDSTPRRSIDSTNSTPCGCFSSTQIRGMNAAKWVELRETMRVAWAQSASLPFFVAPQWR